MRVVSAVYVASATGVPRAADDARHLAMFDPHACPVLAFDHGLIVRDYLAWKDTGRMAPLR